MTTKPKRGSATTPRQPKASASLSIGLTTTSLKRLAFVGHSREDLRAFPEEIKKAVGASLTIVQSGDTPANAKPIQIIGNGTFEISLQDPTNWYRVFYVAKFPEAIYVLHAFTKQTNKTAQQDIDAGQVAYAAAKKASAEAKATIVATVPNSSVKKAQVKRAPSGPRSKK